MNAAGSADEVHGAPCIAHERSGIALPMRCGMPSGACPTTRAIRIGAGGGSLARTVSVYRFSMPIKRRREFWSPPRGAAWLALPLAALGLWTWDAQLKRAAHPGFAPAAASQLLYAADGPAAWSALERSRPGILLREGIAPFRHDAELFVRLLSGIRPTPLRWRLWLGPSLLAAHDGDAWGVCVRPGLLLRAAAWLHGAALARRGEYGTLHYAWREGYLLASASRTWVDAALQAPPARMDTGADLGMLSYRVAANPLHLSVSVRCVDDLPVEARIEGLQPEGDSSPVSSKALQGIWPKETLLALSLEDGRPLRSVWLSAREAMRQRGMEAWSEALAKFFDVPAISEGAGVSLAVAELAQDAESILPVFALALDRDRAQAVQLRTQHPLASLLPEAARIPARWNDVEGLRIPIWGEGLSLCLAADEEVWLATTQEPLMERLTRGRPPASFADTAVLLEMNWASASRAASILLEFLARAEVITRTPQEIQRDFGPLLEALPELGRLYLEGRPEGSVWRLRGHLAEPPA